MTGGTRGIGGAISRSLAEQGAEVAAGYSRDRENAEAFIDELAKRRADWLSRAGQRRLGGGLPPRDRAR